MIDYDEFEEEQRRREAEFDSVAEYLEKKKRIDKEVRRLKRLFSKIDENKKNSYICKCHRSKHKQ